MPTKFGIHGIIGSGEKVEPIFFFLIAVSKANGC